MLETRRQQGARTCDISVKGSYPDRADGESHHTTLETRLFSLLGDPLVDTLS